MKHLGTKTIHTARLVLRRFAFDDAQAMFNNWASDPEVTRFLSWPAHSGPDVSRLVINSWVEGYAQDDFYQWAIEFDGQPIGSISVVAVNERVNSVEIGYCIGKQWWHQGITSEALTAVIKFFFEEVGADRVAARHDPANSNSGAVMRKCGMKYEGTLRSSYKCNHGICDVSWYSILRSEYFGR